MTLAQLKYFVKVAQNGHLTQTAKELLIAQPSLTQAIKQTGRRTWIFFV